MSTEVASERKAGVGLMRGLKRRCPNCGEGRLFRGYLKVEGTCPACGHDNAQYRADDGPAYFTILLVGHLVIAPMLCFSIIWKASPEIVVPAVLGLITVVTLTALPFIKGGFIGVQWATKR